MPSTVYQPGVGFVKTFGLEVLGLREPAVPPNTRLLNKPLKSRPRVLPIYTKWQPRSHPHGLPGPHGLPQQSKPLKVFARGLENPDGVCYRNSVLQILLNSPLFVNWVMKHKDQSNGCHRQECLICGFKELASAYHHAHDPANANTFRALRAFWALCLKLFWGPGPPRKRTIGPLFLDDGGDEASFLFWLLQEMREHVKHIPSDFQFLERIFCRHIATGVICKNVSNDCQMNAIMYPSYLDSWQQNMDEPGSHRQVTNIQDEVNEGSNIETLRPSTMVCSYCESDEDTFQLDSNINLPEIIFLYYPRKSEAISNYLREVPLLPKITVPMSSSLAQGVEHIEYMLTAVTLLPTWVLDDPEDTHVYTATLLSDGNVYLFDDDMIEKVSGGWAELDSKQRLPDQSKRLLPSIFVYTRKPEPVAVTLGKRKRGLEPEGSAKAARYSPTMPGGFTQLLRKSSFDINDYMNLDESITDPTTAKLVRDISTALPDLRSSDILAAIGANQNLQHTMEVLTTHSGLTNTLTLDDIPLSYRASVLQLYAESPHERVQDLFDAVRNAKNDVNAARQSLQHRDKVTLGYEETVGHAKFTSWFHIRPSNITTPDAEVQVINGDYTYKLAGRTWTGTFHGTGKLTERPQPQVQLGTGLAMQGVHMPLHPNVAG